MGFKITKNTWPIQTKAAAAKIRKDLRRALRLVAESKRTIVVKRTPKDVGTLRNTVHVEGPEEDGNTLRVSIVAGGPAAPYAIVQHENLDYHHTEGQAKYIESVILESRPTIAREIAALVKF